MNGKVVQRGRDFRSSACLFLLRRKVARAPKKVPAAVNTQMVMVTAVSLVVIMSRTPGKIRMHNAHSAMESP